MNKIYSLAFVAALLAVTTATAHADDWTTNLRPYVGADYQFTHLKYNNDYGVGGGLALDGNTILERGLNGGNVHVGVRPAQYWGAELGYFDTTNESKNIAAGTTVGPGTVALVPLTGKVQMHGATLDAMGYLPVIANRVDLIATTGLAWDHIKAGFGGLGSVSKSEIDWRIGGGAQVNLLPNLNLRGLVRYQTADFKNIADSAWVYTAGLNYSF